MQLFRFNQKQLSVSILICLLIYFVTKVIINKINWNKWSLVDQMGKLNETSVKERFNFVYKNFVWKNVGGGSGEGSTIEYTRSVRSILHSVIHEYSIASMLDAPCGSFHWMPLLLQNITDEFSSQGHRFRYHGVDAVESIINASRTRYANNTDWTFSTCDFSEEKLPDDYELVFSRDALQHLSYAKVIKSLKAYSQVNGARYLLVGSYLNSSATNRDIEIGGYFPIDVTKPPFNLTKYLRVYKEIADDSEPKSLLLYDIPGYLRKIDFDRLIQI